MSRGSSIDRTINFFREANLDTMRVTFQLVREVVESRLAEAAKAKKSQATAAATMTRRKRRTKAEIAEDNRRAETAKQTTLLEEAQRRGQPGSITA